MWVSRGPWRKNKQTWQLLLLPSQHGGHRVKQWRDLGHRTRNCRHHGSLTTTRQTHWQRERTFFVVRWARARADLTREVLRCVRNKWVACMIGLAELGASTRGVRQTNRTWTHTKKNHRNWENCKLRAERIGQRKLTLSFLIFFVVDFLGDHGYKLSARCLQQMCFKHNSCF